MGMIHGSNKYDYAHHEWMWRIIEDCQANNGKYDEDDTERHKLNWIQSPLKRYELLSENAMKLCDVECCEEKAIEIIDNATDPKALNDSNALMKDEHIEGNDQSAQNTNSSLYHSSIRYVII